jgi:TetR/AcrR family transcriptional regulator
MTSQTVAELATSSQTKLNRRERENLRQRKEILEAALQLFSNKGFHKVSMHEIAKQAEFGIGTLYKFFINKEFLYKALLVEKAESWHQRLMEILDQDGYPIDVIENYLNLRQKLFFDNLPLMRLYFAETRGASLNIRAGLDDELSRLYDEGLQKLATVFSKGIHGNYFRELDPYCMAVALDGVINAFLFRSIKDQDRFDQNQLDFALEVFLTGILNK